MSTDPYQPRYSPALYDNVPSGEVIRVVKHGPSRSSPNIFNKEQVNTLGNMEQKKMGNSEQDQVSPLNNVRNTKKLLNPLRIEEKIYADKYHETLEQEAGFHKNSGFFTQFASRNKILNDQYKSKRAQPNGHSRYISKPVLFTALKTKNKLSQVGIVDHSQILRETKYTEIKSSLLTVTPRGPLNKDERMDSSTVKSPGKTGSSPLLTLFDNERKLTKERLLPIKTAKDTTDYSPHSTKNSKQHAFSAKALEELKIDPARTKLSVSKDQKSLSTLLTNTQASFTNGRFTDCGSPIKCFSVKSRPKLQSPTNSKTFQEMSRYHTKFMADSLLNQYTERSKKVDPVEYLEHSQDIDFMRNTTIAIGQLDQDKKYAKKHPGVPEPYSAKNKIATYQEPNTLESIGRFEENIIGWTKSVPNFGKQRWTYEKDWEFRLI